MRSGNQDDQPSAIDPDINALIIANQSVNQIITEIKQNFFNKNSTLFANFAYGGTSNYQNFQTDDKTLQRLKGLSTIARAYSTFPYTNVTECADTKDAPLIISLAYTSKIPSNSIVNRVADSLCNVSKDLNDQNAKQSLFKDMYIAGNTSIYSLLLVAIKNENNQEKKKIYKTLANELKSEYNENKRVLLLEQNKDLFNEFISSNFVKMFPKEELEILGPFKKQKQQW
jgi:hypothetical protein